MLSLIVLSVLLLAVVVFALQNAQAVTVRLLFWQLESSAAIVVLAATATGALIGELFRLASRLLRWKRRSSVTLRGERRRFPLRPTPLHAGGEVSDV